MPNPVEAEVVSPEAGPRAMPVYGASTLAGRITSSPQFTWFILGAVAGAVALGLFVWKTGERKKS